MPSIPYVATDVVDVPWDGPGTVAKIPNDAGEAVLRKEYAWVDPDADPNTKSAYKFSHHEVIDGKPAAANINGVRNALARIGQAKPPLSDSDAAGVKAHLQKHIDAFNSSRSADPPRDDLFRAAFPGLELRESEAALPVMFGHFAVFNTWTEVNSVFEGHFLERFATGAFTKTLQENRARIRPLLQHGRDPQAGLKPLGPVIELCEDDTGVYYEVQLLDTSYNRDLLPGLQAGLYGASFRFGAVKQNVVRRPPRSAYNPDGLPERTITEAYVKEFGPVTFAAYNDATAGVRSITDEFRPDQGTFMSAPISVNHDADLEQQEGAGERSRLYERTAAYAGSRVWAMTPDKLAVVQHIFAERLNGIHVDDEQIARRIGVRDQQDIPVPASIAVIPVGGPIVPHAGMIDRTSSELTSVEQLQQQFRAALANLDIGAILFNIDSPGGSADLVPEFAAEILNARGGDKPIWAVANTDALSAAYWIASATDMLLVTPSGYLGSVGVWTMHTDLSAAMEKAGVKNTFVSFGEYKVDGNPFEPLSDTAKAEMQTQVDAIGETFVNAVAAGRNLDPAVVAETFGQGAVVMAADAVKRGMADKIATVDQAAAMLAKKIGAPSREAGASHSATDGRTATALDRGAGSRHSSRPSRSTTGHLASGETTRPTLDKEEKPTWQL